MSKTSNCPDWFNISNYDPCEKFSRAAWFMAFYCRKQKKSLGNIIRRSSRDFMENMVAEYASEHHDKGQRISNATLGDITAMLLELSTEQPKVKSFLQDELENGNDWTIYEAGHRDEFNLTISEELVHVDLNATDDVLKEEFDHWLRQKRETQGNPSARKRMYSESDFADWHKHKLLAYIDLTDYCVISGQELTNKQKGDLLFPNEYDIDIAERVRKVVAKRCGEIMANLDLGKIGVFFS
jgi:hypothetical protein